MKRLPSKGKTENLLKVESVDRVKMEVTLSDTPSFGRDWSKCPLKHPFLRRWDGMGTVKNGKDWIELEGGIQIQFIQEQGDNVWFRSGDWWWIPARTATGDVEWPRDIKDDPVAQKPLDHGHCYAPLALINVNADGSVEGEPVDLRRKFIQLWE